jgi:tripartite-type tricarboxylate transporter receptor subunit TctC
MRGRHIIAAALIAVISAGLSTARAQSVPDRPIRMIVPFAAGGLIDQAARLVAQQLSSRSGQTVLVENSAGTGGTVAASAVAQAAPDGRTLLFASSTALTLAPLMVQKVNYDPRRSFTPIAPIAERQVVLVVNPAVPAKTCPELVQHAKDNPGKLHFSSPGTGTVPHFTGELFKMRAGIQITHIPFRGVVPAITSVVTGDVQLTFEALPDLLTHINAGRLRPIAIASIARTDSFPELPTIIECGYPSFVSSIWAGLVAPAGTPPDVVARLNASVNAGLRDPETQAALRHLGFEPVGGRAEDLSAMIGSEVETWASVARAAGISPQ